MSTLEWKGQPVPWVALWSGESIAGPIQVGQMPDGRVRAFYEDGNEFRDDRDVLWMREGIGRTGVPNFGEVSAFRQRAAMRRRLCQVCGEKIESKVIRWLLHPSQIVTTPRTNSAITISPPTCDDCVDLSISKCPVMKRDDSRVIARVLEYEVWGVWGTIARFGEDGQGQTSGRNYIAYDRPDIDMQAVIAKQQVVKWTKFVMEDS